jgi:hypothetical protein
MPLIKKVYTSLNGLVGITEASYFVRVTAPEPKVLVLEELPDPSAYGVCGKQLWLLKQILVHEGVSDGYVQIGDWEQHIGDEGVSVPYVLYRAADK